MKNKIYKLLSLFLFILFPTMVSALGDYYLRGTSTLIPGNEGSIVVGVRVSSSSVNAASGNITNSNNSCVQIKSISGLNGTSTRNGSFIYANLAGGATGSVDLLKIVVYASSSSCSSTIKITDPALGFSDGGTSTNGASININVTAPLSTNNNLSKLTINNGTLSPTFNSSITNYNVTVESNISSININANAEDSKSTVSGTGTKNLSYGKNSFNIVVKAQNGSTKTYTINVIRKDNRGSDTTLKSLTVNGGTLTPSFNKDTYEYNLSVPYSINKLNINATPNDSKSVVTLYNPELVAEETTQVKITVKAENGNTKTYNINVSRGKDPNKILSKDNNLISLIPSVGILSPVFDSNKTNYVIYLPYEIDNIHFDYQVSDTKYAKVESNNDERLKPNSANKFIFKVSAEDESIKEYTVIVYRAENPESDSLNAINAPTSTKLKSITITNGKLINEFNSDIYSYTYKKNKDFKIEYELEDESSYANIYYQDNNIYIIVENESGDTTIYCLHEYKKENNNIKYIIIIITLIIVIILLILGIIYKDKILKKINKKHKNSKKNKIKKTPSK